MIDAGPGSDEPVPRILCDAPAVTANLPASSGALWKLAEPGRQLDANLIHLAAGQHIDTHVEPDLDVLLIVLTGNGCLGTVGETLHLTSGAIVWLPRGSERSLAAADDMTYLTVHQRRAGLQIRPPGSVTPGPG